MKKTKFFHALLILGACWLAYVYRQEIKEITLIMEHLSRGPLVIALLLAFFLTGLLFPTLPVISLCALCIPLGIFWGLSISLLGQALAFVVCWFWGAGRLITPREKLFPSRRKTICFCFVPLPMGGQIILLRKVAPFNHAFWAFLLFSSIRSLCVILGGAQLISLAFKH